MKNSSKKRGFTIIELLVVSTIIAILAAIGMVSFSAAGKSARDGKRKSDMETMKQALTLYRQQYSSYPNDNFTNVANTLAGQSYISQPVPVDPGGSITASYTYIYGTAVCVCAQLEDPSKSNSDISCNFSAGSKTHYCAKTL